MNMSPSEKRWWLRKIFNGYSAISIVSAMPPAIYSSDSTGSPTSCQAEAISAARPSTLTAHP